MEHHYRQVYPGTPVPQLDAAPTPIEAENNRKKRHGTCFTSGQISTLEKEYGKRKYLPATRRKELSVELSLHETNIKIWFQNRRMKEKKIEKCSINYLRESLSEYLEFPKGSSAESEMAPIPCNKLTNGKQILDGLETSNNSANLETLSDDIFSIPDRYISDKGHMEFRDYYDVSKLQPTVPLEDHWDENEMASQHHQYQQQLKENNAKEQHQQQTYQQYLRKDCYLTPPTSPHIGQMQRLEENYNHRQYNLHQQQQNQLFKLQQNQQQLQTHQQCINSDLAISPCAVQSHGLGTYTFN